MAIGSFIWDDRLHIGETRHITNNFPAVSRYRCLQFLLRRKRQQADKLPYSASVTQRGPPAQKHNLLQPHAAPARLHQGDMFRQVVLIVKMQLAGLWVQH
jgi:hypothetical protein